MNSFEEFQTVNFTLQKSVKRIKQGDKIRYITDNTDPLNIKTYVFFQRNAAINPLPNGPSMPNQNWSTYEASFDHDHVMTFNTLGVVLGILTDEKEYFIRVN